MKLLRTTLFPFTAIVLALMLALAPTGAAWAQKKKKSSKSSKGGGKAEEAAKLITQADALYNARETTGAITLYKQAVRLQPQNAYALDKLGRCNQFLQKFDEAAKWFNAAVDVDPNKDTTWLRLGMALKRSGNYEESTRAFERVLELHKQDDYIKQQAKLEIAGNKFAEKQSKAPTQWELAPMSFNAKGNDQDPNILKVGNNRFMVFTSHRVGNMGKVAFAETGEEQMSDQWQIQMSTDSTFRGKPENMGKMLNTNANDGFGCISPDGKTMYFSICGQGKTKLGFGCSIYESTFNEKKKSWGKYQLVQGVNGTEQYQLNSKGKMATRATFDTHPVLTPDGQTMYFISNRKQGGYGEGDIWYSKRAGNTWTAPVNAGRTVNSEFNEAQPLIADDGKTLYFATDGRAGFGGYDIYKAEGGEGTWSEPKNMGRDINSSADDYSILWMEKDSLGYLTTNRTDAGGRGRYDIYMIRKIPNVPTEEIVITVQGRVRDLKTKQAIPFATVTLYLTKDSTITPLDTFKTDQSGSYKFSLERGNDYKLIGNAPEYLANEESISTKDMVKSAALEKDIDIFLERIEVNKPIVLQNIYYDFDKALLRDEAMAELDRLLQILNDNPGMTILVGSHTDTNGSEKYNIGLSNRRAKSVVDYLLKKGINKNRIVTFGYGESQPLIYPELSDSDEQANRRSEFRIRTMDLPTPAKPVAKTR